MLNWLDDWLAEYEQMMLTSALVFINWAMQRGITYASTELNRLSPNYQTGDGWTPADDDLKNELVVEINGYITDLIADLGAIRGIITSDKERPMMISEIKKVLSVAKNNVDSTTKTMIIDSFNEVARRRWKAWGVKKYMFWSSLDPVVCDKPKKLRDGTIAERGCEGLHGTIWDIDDTVHRPTIHLKGRCTILPVIE